MVDDRVCGLFGVFLAFSGLVLKIVGVSLPHFVDIVAVSENDLIDDNTRLGGIGVFSSEFDSTFLEPQVQTDLGIPDISIKSKTVNFPLLFPAQQNLVFDILPFNEQALEHFDDTFDQTAFIESLEDEINNIKAIEFESCEETIPEIFNRTLEYFTVLQSETLPLAVTAILNSVGSFGFDPTFPQLSNNSYEPCLSLRNEFENLTDAFDNECSFSSFFDALIDILGSVDDPNVVNVLAIDGIYDTCVSETGGFLDLCPIVFGAGLIDAAFQNEVGFEGDIGIFISSAVDQCELDDEDNEKIAQAQLSLMLSFVFQSAALLVGCTASCYSLSAGFGYILSSFSSLFAGGLTLTALLVVRSAPVYESVGNDSVENGVIFEEGFVAILALVDAILLFIAAISFCLAAFQSFRSDSIDFDEK